MSCHIQDIHNIQDILNFWFGNDVDKENKDKEFWFDQSKDDYIKEKYSILLTNLEKSITKDNYKEIENNENILATIIVMDQFSRSIYRNCNKNNIKENDEIAFLLSSILLERKYDKEISLAKRIFILMPYRHQKKSDCLDIVLEKINEYSKELGESPLLCRFRNATLSSYTPLVDRIFLYDKNDKNVQNENFIDVIDEKYFTNFTNFTNNDEDEHDPKESIYKTIKFFVAERKIKNIGISLSGGVDSMVISYILNLMSNTINLSSLYALHIEYCNREESKRETEFIASYCKKLNISLYIRKINYMSRESVHRNFYEEETRKIRFSTYQYLSEKHNISGWCLGHHKGDISENILMNIYNGRNLLDLTVMKKESFIDNVTLYRPLLDHPKSDIYDFAYRNCIPYLKDTTPDWSSRGVLRRKILPEMNKQWPMAENNLLEMGKQSEELESIVKNFVLEPLKRGIVINKDNNQVDINLSMIDMIESVSLPKIIWLNLFLYIFHKMGIHMISHKNLSYFVESFSRNYEKKYRFMFSNGCIGFFMKNNLRIIRVNK